MRRFAITGPESTGKTTLSKELASAFSGIFIPEFAREYLLTHGGKYDFADLDIIAKGQLKLWEKAGNNQLIFCDTEMLVMKIWSEFKYGQCSSFIQHAFEKQQFDHYFLCSPDIAWEEDPLREHPEERETLFKLYQQVLEQYKIPFTIIKGNEQERFSLAKSIVAQSNKTGR